MNTKLIKLIIGTLKINIWFITDYPNKDSIRAIY